jgi:anti-sigma B factor antagonist
MKERMQALSIDPGADGTLGVTLRGEIDFVNSAEIGEAIRAALAAHERTHSVRVDLGEVTFLDSSGIGVLVRAMRAAGEVGAAFRVERPNELVFDQLRTTGLLEVFGLRDALADGA